jgi:hypothetical protein
MADRERYFGVLMALDAALSSGGVTERALPPVRMDERSIHAYDLVRRHPRTAGYVNLAERRFSWDRWRPAGMSGVIGGTPAISLPWNKAGPSAQCLECRRDASGPRKKRASCQF